LVDPRGVQPADPDVRPRAGSFLVARKHAGHLPQRIVHAQHTAALQVFGGHDRPRAGNVQQSLGRSDHHDLRRCSIREFRICMGRTGKEQRERAVLVSAVRISDRWFEAAMDRHQALHRESPRQVFSCDCFANAPKRVRLLASEYR
jgi:hypothetical protein